MKMNNILSGGILHLFLIACFGMLGIQEIEATSIQDTQAKKLAIEFFTPKASLKSQGVNTISTIPIVYTRYQSTTDARTPVFVFENKIGGFAIIAQTQAGCKVVGYSTSGKINLENIPSAFVSLLQFYEKNNAESLPSVDNVNEIKVSVAPLLDAVGIGLNQFRHENVGNCYSGCVATAMTQIMAYHKFPEKGVGSHCFTHGTYGQLCADFGNTTYNWTGITNTDYKNLSYQMGIAMNMNYCSDASGSSPAESNYLKTLDTFFNYNLIIGANESDYVIDEINQKRPVYCEFYGKPSHAVVLDGYNEDGFFHVNFGWGGSYNGYFQLNNSSTLNVGAEYSTNIGYSVFASPKPFTTLKEDSLALVAFHNGMNGSTGWELTKPVSKWKGILVINQRVVKIEFYSSNDLLTGNIPSEIGNLTELKSLNISGFFSGTLPTSISKLTNLETLIIDAQHPSTLKGSLPIDLGNLNKLKILSVIGLLEGTLPASLGELTELKTFRASGGNLTGNIPSSICNLTKLTELDLSKHKLSESIPLNIGQLTKLTKLNLSDNKLTGKVPESISSLTELIELNLSKNQLIGALPVGIGNLIKVKNFDISNNNITAIPDEFGIMDQLEYLYLNANKLITLPSTMNNLSKIKLFHAQNNLIDELPKDFGSWPDVLDIDLSNNQLKLFPIQFCYISGLNSLQLQNNKISLLPFSVQDLPYTMKYLNLENNDMTGIIPSLLLESDITELYLKNNRFSFENLMPSTKYMHKVGLQKNVKLTKNVIKVMMGDTVKLDIRKLTGLQHPDNQYFWCKYPRYINEERVAYMSGIQNNPVIQLIINEKTIRNKYYCKVFNTKSPTYTFVNGANSYPGYACLTHLNTDSISFQLATDDEMYAEKFSDSYVITSEHLLKKELEDKTVTLVPPMKLRGELKWQASSDKKVWYDIGNSMPQADLKANIVSIHNEKLVLSPVTPAYYRSVLTALKCDPVYSDTVKVNPYGRVLYDSITNVISTSKTIALDSIEVTIPEKFHDKDFRLTVVKLDKTPAVPEGYKMGSVYDVNVSFGNEFDTPLFIKLKNVNKEQLNDTTVMKYKPIYYNDVHQNWVEYENGSIALKDSCLNFFTYHLTKLSWWNPEEKLWGFTDEYVRNNIRVVWAQKDELSFKYVQTPQKWHISGVPVICQDITEFLSEVRIKLKNLYNSDKTITVYLKNMPGSDGEVGIYAMINKFVSINKDISEPIRLRSTLAHEFMHLVQDYYLVASIGNMFWMEATAHLTDRMVWDEKAIPKSESEGYLADSFETLSTSWDFWDKTTVGGTISGVMKGSFLEKCYPAGTFIHYMRSYRTGEKLNPETLLKESPSTGSWRNYLESYIKKYLNSNIGDEYESFIKYILKIDDKRNFTLLTFNPNTNKLNFNGFENSFVKKLRYEFKDTIKSITEKIDFKLPYLSARFVYFYNRSINYSVVMNYKRDHGLNNNLRVYYGKYNFNSSNIDLIDITDSLKYNIFLESYIREKVKRQNQNAGFLVFINKDSPQSFLSETELDASFEITATPVIDFADLEYVTVAPDELTKKIHNYDDGSKDGFWIAGELENFENNRENKTYSASKTLTGDSLIVVKSNFSNQTTTINGIGIPNTIQRTEKTQTIEYNFIKGDFTIVQVKNETYTLSAYHDERTNKDIPERDWITQRATTRIQLSGVVGFEKVPDKKQVFFKSKSTTDTQQIIEKMSSVETTNEYNSDGSSTVKVKRYLNTDYASDEVFVYLWLQTE